MRMTKTIGMVMSGAGALACALSVAGTMTSGAPHLAMFPAAMFFPNAMLFAYWLSR